MTCGCPRCDSGHSGALWALQFARAAAPRSGKGSAALLD